MTDRMQTVQGRCPACGNTLLFLGGGGHVTCSLDVCPNPSAADDLLHGGQQKALEQAKSDVAELGRSVVEWADLAKRHQHWGQRRWNAWKSARGRAQRLAAELAALRQVARGYCPECGRGDAAPTVDDWWRERNRAMTAEVRLTAVRDLRDDLRGITGARWIADALDNILDQPAPMAATQATDRRVCGDVLGVAHIYLSTGCLHGQHGYCQTGLGGAKKAAVCKRCEAPCQCPCHQEQPDA